MKLRGVVLVGLVAIVLAAAVGAHALSGASKVNVILATKSKPFDLTPTPARAGKGKVTFVVSNKGQGLDHEFVVLKTNLPPTKLKVKGSKAVETGRVGKLLPLKPGQTKTLTLTLAPGKYVLICNLPGHYKAGQRAAFRVG